MVFEDTKLKVQKWKIELVYNLWSWAGALGDENTKTFAQFVSWLGS